MFHISSMPEFPHKRLSFGSVSLTALLIFNSILNRNSNKNYVDFFIVSHVYKLLWIRLDACV